MKLSVKQMMLSGAIFFAASVVATAQTVISIETQRNAMAFQVEQNNDLNMIYYGKKLSSAESYREINAQFGARNSADYTKMLTSAYTSSGSRNLVEPAIAVTHADGNNSLDLKYVSHEIKKEKAGVEILKISLKDPVYAFEVDLFYKSFFEEDMIEQWSVIRHSEKGAVTLHKYASANLTLRENSYWLRHYHGDWAKEMQAEEDKLAHGIKTLDTKLGARANLFQPPSFMVSIDKPATEDEGAVLFGSLEWSGNFKIDFEVDPTGNLRIIPGINNFASDYSLKSGAEFETPPFVHTLSHEGKGRASRNFHDWARKHKILDGMGERLTLLNNWEATYFDFDEKKLTELLKDTKKLGVDLFLLDDGWFANKYPRNNDRAGLGDWQENKTKLPSGIGYLVKEAGKNDVKFGIWIEPEMVNPKSELYENHPQWVIKQPNRDEYYFRNQLVLDLSNPEVQDFVFGVVDNLFTQNPNLAYIKWDCNSVIYNAYSPYLDSQSHLYVEYVKGLYSVLQRIRAKYPIVPIMLCSGGGGRADYGILQYFTEFWLSDNTDPLERVFMQWEYSYFFPAICSSNHVTDWGRQPIKYRTDVAMMGKLGFDIVVSHLSEKDLQFCQEAIKNYNRLKHVIWHGDQYRLSHPQSDDAASIMYVDKNRTKAIIFSYLVNNRYGSGNKLPLKLKGLDPAKKYSVKEINVYPEVRGAIQEKVYAGDFLMNVGFDPRMSGSRASVILEISEQ